MIGFFEAHVCSVGDVEDINTFLIVLADQAVSPMQYLELQRSLEHDEQDAALGMDTYCVVTDTGATHYGGIVSCILKDDSLVLVFSEEAESELGLKGYRIILALSAANKALLRSGLIKLFDRDKYVPQDLSL